MGTSAARLPVDSSGTPVVQNLGPGKVYLDTVSTVTTANGLELEVGDVYEFPHDLSQAGGGVYAIADQANTDVRLMVVG